MAVNVVSKKLLHYFKQFNYSSWLDIIFPFLRQCLQLFPASRQKSLREIFSISCERIARVVYLFDPAFPEISIPGMMEAQIQMPGFAMVTLFGVLAHMALLSDPGKPSDTQNEFAQTWRRIAYRATSTAQFHPFCSRFRTSWGKRVCLVIYQPFDKLELRTIAVTIIPARRSVAGKRWK